MKNCAFDPTLDQIAALRRIYPVTVEKQRDFDKSLIVSRYGIFAEVLADGTVHDDRPLFD